MSVSLEAYETILNNDERRMVAAVTVNVTQAEACRMIAQHLDDAARLYAQIGGVTSLTNALIEKLVSKMRGFRPSEEDEPEDPGMVAAQAWLEAAFKSDQRFQEFREERGW